MDIMSKCKERVHNEHEYHEMEGDLYKDNQTDYPIQLCAGTTLRHLEVAEKKKKQGAITSNCYYYKSITTFFSFSFSFFR